MEEYADSETNDQFERWRGKMVHLIETISARLSGVIAYVAEADSLPNVITVGVTIREITYHLKPLTLPSKSAPEPLMNNPKSSGENDNQNTSGVKGQLKQERFKAKRTLTEEQQEIMESAVKYRAQVIRKTKAQLFTKIMTEQTSAGSIFKDGQLPLRPPSAPYSSSLNLSTFIDKEKVYYNGTMSKKSGSMRGFSGRKWKIFLWSVDSEKIECCCTDSKKAQKVYFISDIQQLIWNESENPKELKIIDKHHKNFKLKAETSREIVNLILTIDSIRTLNGHTPLLSSPEKKKILARGFFEGFQGGEIKSSFDEDWSYTPSGYLKSIYGHSNEMVFKWDGELLIGEDEYSKQFGYGKWNGINLLWYENHFVGVPGEPVVRYDYLIGEREFYNVEHPSQAWKWTRHFLASKFGAGEWIVEGQIPDPIVMFLQVIRNARLGHSHLPPPSPKSNASI